MSSVKFGMDLRYHSSVLSRPYFETKQRLVAKFRVWCSGDPNSVLAEFDAVWSTPLRSRV